MEERTQETTEFYQDLIYCVEQMGWRVRHYKTLKNGIIGQFRLEKKYIAMRNDYKNTIVGCFVLGHEVGHLADFIDNKFEKFYNSLDGYVTDKKLIERAEWSPTKFSNDLLKDRNIKFEVKYSEFKKCLLDWYTDYSGQPIWAHVFRKK